MTDRQRWARVEALLLHASEDAARSKDRGKAGVARRIWQRAIDRAYELRPDLTRAISTDIGLPRPTALKRAPRRPGKTAPALMNGMAAQILAACPEPGPTSEPIAAPGLLGVAPAALQPSDFLWFPRSDAFVQVGLLSILPAPVEIC
jgi:hypothetical protein